MAELTLGAIEQLLDKRLSALEQRINKQFEQSEQRTTKRFDEVDKRFVGIDKRFDEVMEVVEFVRDNAASHEDVAALRSHMDRKFSEQAVSLAFMETQISALRKDFDRLSKRTSEDTSAFVKDILKLRNRVETLEKQVKQLVSGKHLQTARAQ